MTAVKSQWGGLEAAAPPAFVGGKQRGVLLLAPSALDVSPQSPDV